MKDLYSQDHSSSYCIYLRNPIHSRGGGAISDSTKPKEILHSSRLKYSVDKYSLLFIAHTFVIPLVKAFYLIEVRIYITC